MSGGHFNYKQHHLLDMADDIGSQILTNNRTEKNEWGDSVGNRYNAETIAEFEKAVKALKLAYIYAQRIDWLLSGDDGEDGFHRRLKAQLGEAK
tara:strand:+ start:2151 stop:2432 length:282 start_codon:yes stop_codon:yes gene_type:complete